MPHIERHGLQIHYKDIGQGRVLVLLHELLFDSAMWTPQIEALSHEFRVITIDLRGHGGSTRTEQPFTLYDLTSDVVAVLDACRVGRAVWMGLSLGGMIALRAAIVVPEAVEALILLGSDAGTEPAASRFRRRAVALGAKTLGIAPFLPFLSGQMFSRTARRKQKDLVRDWEKRFVELDARSVRCSLEAVLRRDSIHPLLHEIDVPVLVMVGEKDEIHPPRRSRDIAAGIIGARFEIVPDAGHLANLERPEVVNPLIAEFLRSSSELEEPGSPPGPPDDGSETAVQEQFADSAFGDEAPVAETAEDAPRPDLSDDEIEVPASAELDHAVSEPSMVDEPEIAGAEIPPVAEEIDRKREELEPYTPEEEERKAPEERPLPGGKPGSERRRKRRVAPSRKLYGRVGHVGIVLIDVSESGARIEHYNRRFQTRSKIMMEIEWEGRALKAECEVVSCRVHRFIPGEKGATVYQSGVLFQRMNAESREVLKELVARLVTRGLAEQVANARGIGPVLQRDMPTFRAGVVSASGRPREAGSEGPARLIAQTPLTEQTGYIRCRKLGPRWEKKWTLDPAQPREGFTVLATENKLDIEMLCQTWDHGDEEARRFIRDCARASVGVEQSPPDENVPGEQGATSPTGPASDKSDKSDV